MKRAFDVIRMLVIVLLMGPALVPLARGQDHGAHGPAHSSPAQPTSIRITMEGLHAAGGVPPGWRFAVPPGDPAAGRRAFVEFECYACHAITGEQFPLKPGESATAGPDLSGMGSHHPPEYLAESIINPSAVLIDAPGYIGGDGRSNMPAYPDMTLGQLTNLVAYLKTLSAPGAAGHEPEHERVVGGYRIRLRYRQPAVTGHTQHAHGSAMAMGRAPGRLLVFLADAASGQPIPYAPLSATIEAAGKPAQTLKLAPSLGQEGFHYAADVALLEGTRRITVAIGPTTMQLGPGAPEGLKRAQRVAFDWK